MNILRLLFLALVLVVVQGLSGIYLYAEAANPLKPQVIAQEAYIYLYPLVLMDITRRQTTNVNKWNGNGFSAPMNNFGHFRTFPPLDFKTVVRPNFDTLYSSLWMDLSGGPMILTIPDSDGRYYLMPALDMWTDVFAVPGWRTTGTKEGNYAYVAPEWEGDLPQGVTRVDAPTPYIWFVGRTKTDGEKDYDAVHQFQDGLKITPLSEWGKDWNARGGNVDSSVDMKTPPMEQVNSMTGKEFFEYAAKLMKLHPPKATDFSQIARLNQLGIVPGKDLEFSKLDPEIQRALNNAPSTGLKLMQEHVKKLGTMRNGWQMLVSTMGVYGIDYLQRAAVALFGLGANQLSDAIYPQLLTDADGNPMTGDNSYVLHFEKDELPPADAFWSITLYDNEGFPVPNPLNRANLSSWMPLVYNYDGSLDMYLQTESPGADKEANWLPTPKEGEWNLTLRIYAPKPEVEDGTWTPSAIKRVN